VNREQEDSGVSGVSGASGVKTQAEEMGEFKDEA
jgi:hypothetical protein